MEINRKMKGTPEETVQKIEKNYGYFLAKLTYSEKVKSKYFHKYKNKLLY